MKNENVMQIIDKAINSEVAKNWKVDDLKTTWLLRARNLGIEGASADLRDAFILKVTNEA